MDLKTAGVITLDADDVTGDAFISAGSVKLEADQLHIYLSGGTVKYLIEATDGQNGETVSYTHLTLPTICSV